MKKDNNYCSVYVRNSKEGPACYYRIIQYLKKIDYKFKINDLVTSIQFRKNLDIKNLKYKKIYQGYLYIIMLFNLTFRLIYDLIHKPEFIIVSRTFIPRWTPKFILDILNKIEKKSKIIWDFDDDILYSGEISKSQYDFLSNKSTYIIVSTTYLKSMIDVVYSNKVIVLSTTDGDMSHLNIFSMNKKRIELLESEVRIIWVATAVNLKHLKANLNQLDKSSILIYKKYKKKVKLVVVCNKLLSNNTKNLDIINIRWSRKNTIQEMSRAHIGIMPLLDEPYSKGKAGFKLIQYLATALPVIASDVGYNKEIVNNRIGKLIPSQSTTQDWYDAISSLIDTNEKWGSMSYNAYEEWLKRFSFNENLNVWEKILKRG